MAISTRLSLVLIYLFTAICSVRIVLLFILGHHDALVSESWTSGNVFLNRQSVLSCALILKLNASSRTPEFAYINAPPASCTAILSSSQLYLPLSKGSFLVWIWKQTVIFLLFLYFFFRCKEISTWLTFLGGSADNLDHNFPALESRVGRSVGLLILHHPSRCGVRAARPGSLIYYQNSISLWGL